MTSPEARPVPGTLGGVNPGWPTREAKRGKKYDQSYARKRAPFHPEDFDWTYFMAGPSDQWIPGGYLKGDERVVAKNLFASHPNLDTRLPGVRPRVFVQDDEGARREVKLNLDTVTFDGDAETITLAWRGLTPVREIDHEDLAFMLVATEAMTEPPHDTAHYESQLAAFAADPTGLERALAEAKKTERIDGIDPLTAKMMDKGAPVPPELQQAMKTNWEITQERGDPAKLLEEIEKEQEVPDDPPTAEAAHPSIQPRVFLRPQFELLRQQVASVRDKLGPDADLPEGVALMEKKLADPRYREFDPTLREISDGEPGPEADLSGQDFTDRDFSGANLRGAKLDGCVCIRTNFTGADLTGASLDGAMLFKADFSRAFMSGAVLSRVNAAYATFDGCSLDGAKLDGAYFDHATFSGTKLDGAFGRSSTSPRPISRGWRRRGSSSSCRSSRGQSSKGRAWPGPS